MKNYRTLLIDPPWAMKTAGQYKGRHERPRVLPYATMNLRAIEALPVGDLAETGAHLWLWTVNQFFEEAFQLIRAWGFKYHMTVTWAKPSGFGNYFVSRTEHLLFAYKEKCQFNQSRYLPNYYLIEDEQPETGAGFEWGRPKAGQHSKKPEHSYRLIEEISDAPRLEMFARNHQPLLGNRPGWDVWGDEAEDSLEHPLLPNCLESIDYVSLAG